MAKAVGIKAEIRTTVGTQQARKCRRQGFLPGIVYGHQEESLSVAVPTHDFEQILAHGVHLLELTLPGKKETVLIKGVQYDYLGTNPLHVDFTRVDLTERVPVTVHISVRGTPVGIKEGGSLQQVLTDIEIECVVTDIPETLRVNVAQMKIGDALHARDIELPPDVKLLTDADAVICTVSAVVEEAAAEAPVEGEAAVTAEPEVIGKGKEVTEEEQE